ncbi:MAG: cell division protein FtsL [Thiomonas sp.]|jgi:cell division protein FtsL
MMTRINLFLLLAVVLCAMSVVRAQYQGRRLFAALDVAQQRAEQLQMERDRLQVEYRAMSAPGRIEQIARTQLDMRPITPARTIYVPEGATALPPLPVLPQTTPANKKEGRR